MDKTQKRWTVLIVDDTLTNILILKKALLNLDYDVLTAKSGPEGRQIALEKQPDIILLDIMMPGEDGFEAIQKLKKAPQTKLIPVIFLTAMTDIESKIKGFKLGAVDFIPKPFHPAEIHARVGLHIKLSIATKALIESQAAKLKQIEVAQQSLLVQPDDMPNAQFAAYYSSLHAAGGDFYDILDISDNTYGYFIADVSGHDLGTSFITASVKALIQQNCVAIYSPDESMEMVNNVLLNVLPLGKYLTACYITINRKSLKATIVNMGHPPVIFLPKDGKPKLLEYDGDILGAFDGITYTPHTIEINKGDRFYLYTDGLIERGDSSEVWSANLDKLLEMMCNANINELSISESVDKINKEAFIDGSIADDDVVVLGVEV